MAQELKINLSKTAIVVIDLQKGIVSLPAEPHTAKEVVENAAKLLTAVREKWHACFFSSCYTLSRYERCFASHFRNEFFNELF